MKVKVRHIDKAESVPFADIQFDQLDRLIAFTESAGGIYIDGDDYPFNCWQIVQFGGECYVELLYGKDK